MKNNEFHVNDEESKRYRHLTPILYSHAFPGHTDLYYFDDMIKERDREAQLNQKIDCSLLFQEREFTFEEKLISEWYSRFYAETESCSKPGAVTPGYMRTSQARYLTYMYEVASAGLDCYIIYFPRYKEWFWAEMERSPDVFGWHRNPEKNQSQGRLVPILKCARHVPMQRYFLAFDGVCKRVDIDISLRALLFQMREAEKEGQV